MLKATADLSVVAFLYIRYLYKHHLFVDDLGGLVADVIHSTNPCHLVSSFELFGYAFFFGDLFTNWRKRCCACSSISARCECSLPEASKL